MTPDRHMTRLSYHQALRHQRPHWLRTRRELSEPGEREAAPTSMMPACRGSRPSWRSSHNQLRAKEARARVAPEARAGEAPGRGAAQCFT